MMHVRPFDFYVLYNVVVMLLYFFCRVHYRYIITLSLSKFVGQCKRISNQTQIAREQRE